jgi:two-component system CheB/CheR fusion protein
VLLIEDSADVLYLMKLELGWLGYSVLMARNAETGLEIARRELPDLIVSDIKMPGMDGYEFIKRLRRIPELANKPAVALTGFGMKRDVEASLAAGFSAHLSKPVNPEDLSSLIQDLISQRSRQG